MKAAVLKKPYEIVVEEREEPTPRPDEVVLRIGACGICGTDVHAYKGEFPVKYPLVLGHEFAGRIIKVGERVTGFKKGDLVVVEPNLYCGSCYYCRRAMKMFCENWGALGLTQDGGFEEQVAVPVKSLIRMEGGLDYRIAAFTEPVACAIHGQEKIKLRSGESLAIFGAGPMGLIHLQLARLKGATPIVVFDVDENRLGKAQDMGADAVINPLREDLRKIVDKYTMGRGFDNVIEASGNSKAFTDAINILSPFGEMLVFGAAPEEAEVKIKPFLIYRRELKITGSFANPYTMDQALNMLRRNLIDARSLISHILGIEEVERGIRILMERAEPVYKILIEP